MRMRGLLLIQHPSLLDFMPTPTSAVYTQFFAKKRALAVSFAGLIGVLVQFFHARQSQRPHRGCMAALPFELIAEILYRATATTYNVTRQRIQALLEFISKHHEGVRKRLKSTANLTMLEKEGAAVVNGKNVIRVQINLWPPLE